MGRMSWGVASTLAIGLMSGCTGEAIEEEASCASEPLQVCVTEYSDAIAACYAGSDAACAGDDAGLTAALDTLGTALEGCAVAGLSDEASVARLQSACASEATSLASRSYGGPHGAVWADAGDGNRSCLSGAQAAGASLIASTLAAIDSCTAEGDCSTLDATRSDLVAAAESDVASGCSSFPLPDLIAMDAEEFVARADQQADCLAATFTDDDALGLECGPTNAQFEAPRGEWTSITVDSEIWGTQCGDGSPFVFQVRLAPEGEPLDRIVVACRAAGPASSRRTAHRACRTRPGCSAPTTTIRRSPASSRTTPT
ncbi:MAG: hypothetical protein AAF211_02655 [Myxococcota bacterium]